jgi:hypothetical protein
MGHTRVKHTTPYALYYKSLPADEIQITTPHGRTVTAEEAAKVVDYRAVDRAELEQIREVIPMCGADEDLVAAVKDLARSVSDSNHARQAEKAWHEKTKAELGRVQGEVFSLRAEIARLKRVVVQTGCPAPAVTPDTPVTLGMLRELHGTGKAIHRVRLDEHRCMNLERRREGLRPIPFDDDSLRSPIQEAIDNKLGR